MVAYKLYRAHRIREATWRALSTAFRASWSELRAAERARNRAKEGGPSYYLVRRHRVGAALIELVERMMRAGALSTSKAGKVLGVKPINVHKLIRARAA
jgi:hypothetical protein